MILLASAGGSTVPVRARLVQAASTRPTAPGKPFTRRSIRNLADHLSMNTRGASDRPVDTAVSTGSPRDL